MRKQSAEIQDLITGSFTIDVVADVWLASERIASRLRVTDWTLTGNLDSEVKTTGSVTIVHESESGESLRPDGVTGTITPYGSVIELIVTVSAGQLSADISMGRFRVTRVPSAEDTYADVNGARTVMSTTVTAELASLDEGTRRHGFDKPVAPRQGVTCYDEIRRITGMPIVQTVPAQTTPSGVLWEATTGSRLAAVQELAAKLGGVAVVNSRGAWEIVPDEQGAPQCVITIGEDGTLLSLSDEIDPAGVDNAIVGTFEQGDRGSISVSARVTDGPLAVTGPYGESTRYVSSTEISTVAEATEYVRKVLDAATSTQQHDMAATCHFNPLLEIGDVVTVVHQTGTVTGRIVTITLSSAAQTQFTIRTMKEIV